MEIIKGIEMIDLALYFKKEKTLVIADTHVGYEESLNKQGVMIPRFHGDDILKRLEKIVEGLRIETVVINGDLKHEFGTVSDQEWRDALKIIDFLRTKCKKIVLVKGNHDTVLGPIAKKRELELVSEYVVGDTIILHGDVIPSSIILHLVKNIIIGHEHPAIELKYENRTEKYKCFLKGRYGRKILIVMPSMNLITEGNNILTEKILSPFLMQDLSKFKVYVVGEEIFGFGMLKNLA